MPVGLALVKQKQERISGNLDILLIYWKINFEANIQNPQFLFLKLVFPFHKTNAAELGQLATANSPQDN